MANEVRITITGQDKSGPAFDGPNKSAADLAKNLAKVADQLTSTGAAFTGVAKQATSMGAAVGKASGKVADAMADAGKKAASLQDATEQAGEAAGQAMDGAAKKATSMGSATKSAGKRASEGMQDAAKSAHDFEGAAKKTEDAARKSGPAFDDAGKKAKRFGDALHGVGSTASGILAADVFTSAAEKAREFFHSSIEAASSLGESLNAVDKIFGNSSAQIQSWGEQNATSFGLSQRAFNEMAVPLGAMLRNAGMDMDSVSLNTIELTKRAADMASVFNTDVSQALEAIQAGLRGESDPLEQYGVGLSAAAVEARALADTGKSVATQLTDQEKMAARVALIFEQTATSAGDFSSTQDGLANATRIANAELEEAQAKMGQALLPIMAKAAQSAGDLATGFSQLPGPVQTAVAGVGALAAATLILVPRLVATKAALIEAGVVSDSMAGKIGGLAKGMSVAAVAAVGLDVIGNWASTLGGQSKGVDQMTQALEGFAKTGDFAGDLTNTWVGSFGSMEQAGGMMGLAMRKALDPTFLDEWGDPAQRIIGLLPGFSTDMEQAAEKFKSMDEALAQMQANGHGEEAAAAFERIKRMAAELNLPVEKLRDLFPEYFSAVEASTGATNDMASAAGKAAGANKDLAESVDAVTSKLFESEQAEEDYQAAIDSANELVKANRKAHRDAADALDVHTEAGRKNREALREIAEKAKEVTDQMIDMKSPMANIVAVAGNQRAEFIKVATAMLGSKSAAVELANKYGLIPKNVETKIKGDTKQAKGALADFLHQINTSRPKPIPIGADASHAYGVLNQLLAKINGSSANAGIGVLKKATGGTIGRYASGGLAGLGAGAVALVGEQGPELVTLPYGSKVTPAGQSAAILDGESIPGYASGGAVSAPKAPHYPTGYMIGPGGQLYEEPPKKKIGTAVSTTSSKRQIGKAVSVDIGSAVNVGPQIGYAVSVTSGPIDRTAEILGYGQPTPKVLSNMPEASSASTRAAAAATIPGRSLSLRSPATLGEVQQAAAQTLQHATSKRGSGSGVVINVYVQGSIRSDKDLIALIRNEIYNGGLRGVLQTA